MARFGAHAFIWESTWTPDAARRVISSAAQAGLDFVEIPLLRPADFDAAGARGLLEEYGLDATCSLGLPADATLPDDPPAAEAFLDQALAQVERVGSPVLSGVVYGTLGVLPGRAPSEAERDVVAASLKRAARTARTLGLRLGIEPVNRYETHLVNTTEQGLALLAAIDEPNVFLHLDTYHMNIEEKGFAAPIEAAGDALQYIHLSESDRGTPGTGNVRWEDVFAGLAAIGYRGDLVMESFAAVNPDIARATCMWRQVAPSSEVLIRDGLSFLREHAARHGLDGTA
jgi:D-psicose/D-tagatose/L-ribulose 3-epimerase